LAAGERVTVRLLKGTREKLAYEMTVVADDGEHLIVEGPFAGTAARDLGYVVFEPDDWFIEHYWRSRWYSVKAVRDRCEVAKGWYCDVARPASVAQGVVTSIDLDLDVWVPADGSAAVTLDEDEFVASGLEHADPDAAAHARAALAALLLAASGRFSALLSDEGAAGESSERPLRPG
jgi:predicted RNA-binding protein associated with RNAse of E/G family